jgi:hypothetical protein
MRAVLTVPFAANLIASPPEAQKANTRIFRDTATRRNLAATSCVLS